MKLIQILALATAMATMATAQNSGANGQTKATPTPTPAAAGKSSGTTQTGAKKPVSSGQQSKAKPGAATPAPATSSKAAAKPGTPAQGGSASGAPTKPAVKTSTMPVKAHTNGAQAKGSPTPVIAAQSTVKTADTKANAKKPDAKKADTKKKADATKAPAVIAVKPTKETKKPSSAHAKAPVTPAAPKVTKLAESPKTAEKPAPSVRSFGPRGRRDPFVSPIVSKEGVGRPQPNCTNGKRCLVIPELVLQGTIKDTSGKMMAVVANSTRHTYFLRENDQVFQGSVEKITSDSIIFREYVKDALGRETAREVVKKLVPAS
ncbi:MAG TPA: hypothetical protein VGK24_17085 [Candidatus Angelobacter sp.]|jgi:Tfp pilus assembly protein PilP